MGLVHDINTLENLLSAADYSSVTEIEIYNYSQKLKKKILEMRKEGSARDGESSVEILVFKKLRNEGDIEKIIELISKSYINIYNE